MKKLFLALMAIAAIALTGCKDSKKDEPTPKKDVKVTAINPNPVKAGQELIISGESLDLVTKVTFAEGVEVSTFKSQSNEQIVIANFPARAQTGKISMSYVAAGDTTAKQLLSDIELNVVLPSVAEIAEFTEVKAGDKKTIEGKNLDLVVDVLTSVGDTLDFIVSNEGAKIEITMPENVVDCNLYVVAASGVQVQVATVVASKNIDVHFTLETSIVVEEEYTVAIVGDFPIGWNVTKGEAYAMTRVNGNQFTVDVKGVTMGAEYKYYILNSDNGFSNEMFIEVPEEGETCIPRAGNFKVTGADITDTIAGFRGVSIDLPFCE